MMYYKQRIYEIEHEEARERTNADPRAAGTPTANVQAASKTQHEIAHMRTSRSRNARAMLKLKQQLQAQQQEFQVHAQQARALVQALAVNASRDNEIKKKQSAEIVALKAAAKAKTLQSAQLEAQVATLTAELETMRAIVTEQKEVSAQNVARVEQADAKAQAATHQLKALLLQQRAQAAANEQLTKCERHWAKRAQTPLCGRPAQSRQRKRTLALTPKSPNSRRRQQRPEQQRHPTPRRPHD